MSSRSGAAFWALVLITVGATFLLQNLGILPRNAWGAIWPIFLILLGAWLLLGNLAGRGGRLSGSLAVPLDGAREAHLTVRHGAGHLGIGPSSDTAMLVHNTFDGEVEQRTHRDGDRLDVSLRQVGDWTRWMWPRNWGARFDWVMKVNRDVLLSLEVQTGASQADLDLRDLKVSDLKLDTGASTVDLTLPASGRLAARIKAGAATIRVRVPEGVAARVRSRMGLGTLHVNQARFQRSGDGYQSPDYDAAANRADLDIEAGAATITIQ